MMARLSKRIENFNKAIKEAFAANIIRNRQIWIDMANDRNASSHEYNMEKINVISEKISTDYYEDLKASIDKDGIEFYSNK